MRKSFLTLPFIFDKNHKSIQGNLIHFSQNKSFFAKNIIFYLKKTLNGLHYEDVKQKIHLY